MGKARVTEYLGEGLYNVEVLVNRDRIDAELEALAQRLAEINEELAALEDELEQARDDLADASAAVNDGIADHDGEGPANVEAELKALAAASGRVQTLEAGRAVLVFRALAIEQRQQALGTAPPDPVQRAWCADYTESLTGEVATVELPDEATTGQFLTWRRLLIRPGYDGAATYSAERDGQLHHRVGQSPEQAFLNAALLPGVQRWRPQYRVGTLTSVDTQSHTCSLTLQSEESSADGLIIDPPTLQYAFTDVPIRYMECNADAFSAGDRVLIEFQGRDWKRPRVIGFESEPKLCPNRFSLRYEIQNGIGMILNIDGEDWPTSVYFTTVRKGEDGPVVTVRPSDPFPYPLPSSSSRVAVWYQWSDGVLETQRQEIDVQESISVVALRALFPVRVTGSLYMASYYAAGFTSYGTTEIEDTTPGDSKIYEYTWYPRCDAVIAPGIPGASPLTSITFYRPDTRMRFGVPNGFQSPDTGMVIWDSTGKGPYDTNPTAFTDEAALLVQLAGGSNAFFYVAGTAAITTDACGSAWVGNATWVTGAAAWGAAGIDPPETCTVTHDLTGLSREYAFDGFQPTDRTSIGYSLIMD